MSYQRYLIAKTGSMVGDIHVYTEFPENWQYFFNQATMTPDAPGTVDKIVNVRATTVKRGPGDPAPFTRKAHTLMYARNPKSKGSARPGKTYTVAEPNPLGGGYRQKRQFAIQGRDMDIWAYAKAKAKFIIVMWGPNGWYEEIQGAGAGGGTLTVQGGNANP
jgi:hypothetical protein